MRLREPEAPCRDVRGEVDAVFARGLDFGFAFDLGLAFDLGFAFDWDDALDVSGVAAAGRTFDVVFGVDFEPAREAALVVGFPAAPVFLPAPDLPVELGMLIPLSVSILHHAERAGDLPRPVRVSR